MQPCERDKKDIFNETFGKILTKLQNENKLSARAISYGIDISKTTFLLAKNGQLNPQMITFCKLAEAFNLKPSQLLKMIEDELPKNWNFCD